MGGIILTTGEKIRLYREMRGMTQIQLATITEINVGTIRKYELGIRNPKPDQLVKIANGLGKNVSTFYDLDICTAGDIMALLIAVSEKTEITFIGDVNGDGNYDSSEVALKFKSPYMQELMKDWAGMKHEIDMLLGKLDNVTDESVRAEKLLLLSNIYNGFMRILTDKGRVAEDESEIEDLPSSKGLEYVHPFDVGQNFEGGVSIKEARDAE